MNEQLNAFLQKEPVNHIQWIPYGHLRSNYWNPNVVFNQELRLLEHSILKNGWLHPILVRKEDYLIIDGYHRFMLSKGSKKMEQKYAGYTPCVLLDVSVEEAKLITVRINRAKGSHVAVRMSDLISSLVEEHGFSLEYIGKEIGASTQEIEMLYTADIFKAKNLKNYKYSQSWEPKYEKEGKT